MSEGPGRSTPQPPVPAVLLLVFLGGALGSAARELLIPVLPDPWFWIPILLINVLASFLVGWFYAVRARVSPGMTHFIVGGFCGGFSTFSHFSYELVTLGDMGAFLEAAGYLFLTLVMGVGAAVCGERLARRVEGVRTP